MLLKEIKNIFHKELDDSYRKEEVDSFFYMLIEHYLGLERFVLALQPNLVLTKEEEQPLFEALAQLRSHRPIQYIIGKAHFMDMDFSVDENVLIPRPETEELVRWIVEEVRGNGDKVRGSSHDARGKGRKLGSEGYEVRGNGGELRGNGGEVRGNVGEVRGNSHDARGKGRKLGSEGYELRGNGGEVRGNVGEVRGNSHDARGNVRKVGGEDYEVRGNGGEVRDEGYQVRDEGYEVRGEYEVRAKRNDVRDGKYDIGRGKLKILDIGTGSGCIAVSLAKKLPDYEVHALDISPEALQVARKNAKANKVDVTFVEIDILDIEDSAAKYDIMVSNPPYVREQEKKDMHRNVTGHEPGLALFVSDGNPLKFYEAIARFAKKNLKENGSLFLEINQYLAKETEALLRKHNFSEIELRKDMFGNDRMMKGVNWKID